MPWIDREKCTGCGICIAKCPVNVISLEDEKAKIDMSGCIRCGVCHDVCPEEAVRHDSEKSPEIIKKNVETTKRFMDACAEHLGSEKEKEKCLGRMKKHFKREKMIAEATLKELEKLKGE